MKFYRVIGKIDQNIVEQAEKKLTSLFLELATKYDNRTSTSLGGDPFAFYLLYSSDHICTLNIPTAATDGKKYYWNPNFILGLTKMGLRIVALHEINHVMYMHPNRRGKKNPRLWNIAIDYFANGMVFEDLKIREQNASKLFYDNLGDYLTLDDFFNFLKNPFDKNNPANKKQKYYFADPNLNTKTKTPESVYNYLLSAIPKCPECNKLGFYSPAAESSEQEIGNDTCKTCGNCIDVLGFGDMLDEHYDSSESEQSLAKRIIDAMNISKKMCGNVPSAIEDELGKLTEPKITWTDSIRSRIIKYRDGSKNNWTFIKSKPLSYGVVSPKKKINTINFCCLLDTSGSMSKDDMAFGISQLQSLGPSSEGTIVFADSEIYFNKSVKIKNCNINELSALKPVGRGGTQFSKFFKEYKKQVGECNFIIVITDGYLNDQDIAEMIDPGVPVYWVITSDLDFKSPFGKSYTLR